VFFITASLHASGNMAYVLLGTSHPQQWTAAVSTTAGTRQASESDGGVNASLVSRHTSDENAPLIGDHVSNAQTYGAISRVVS